MNAPTVPEAMQSLSLPELDDWARAVMESRGPDFVIGQRYLERWWIVPRNGWCNVYLHRFNRSDDDRALHDHPWASTSFIINGRYIEHTPEGAFHRQAGDVVSRAADALHRVELWPGESATTLFITGPKVRDWGFQCPQGWVPWQVFTDPLDAGQTGRGCGES